MKQLKGLILGIVIGASVGMWLGVNIGKGRSLASNPFAEETLQEQMKNTGANILQKGGEMLKK